MSAANVNNRPPCEFPDLHFSQARDILQPSAALFDSLPLLLADFVCGLAGGSLGDGDAHAPFGVLCHVRRHSQIPALRHKVSGVVSLVGTQGYRLPNRYLFQHHQRRVPLGCAIGYSSALTIRLWAILRQQIAVVAELGLSAMPLHANSGRDRW